MRIKRKKEGRVRDNRKFQRKKKVLIRANRRAGKKKKKSAKKGED